MTGDPADPRYVPTDPKVLDAGLAARHNVSKLDIATLVLNFPQSQGLDDGELHLLAFLYQQGLSEEAAIMISTADKAAIVVAGLLGWLDFLVPLESMAEQSGVSRGQIAALAGHHRAPWLDETKVKIRLGILPYRVPQNVDGSFTFRGRAGRHRSSSNQRIARAPATTQVFPQETVMGEDKANMIR
jgi:hypothetical protein